MYGSFLSIYCQWLQKLLCIAFLFYIILSLLFGYVRVTNYCHFATKLCYLLNPQINRDFLLIKSVIKASTVGNFLHCQLFPLNWNLCCNICPPTLNPSQDHGVELKLDTKMGLLTMLEWVYTECYAVKLDLHNLQKIHKMRKYSSSAFLKFL